MQFRLKPSTIRRVSVKFVPKSMIEQQKQLRLEIDYDMLDCANRDSDNMKTIIIGDEKWVSGYEARKIFIHPMEASHINGRSETASRFC